LSAQNLSKSFFMYFATQNVHSVLAVSFWIILAKDPLSLHF
jgi:hypothetical protein